MMDHATIERDSVRERYLIGRLSPEEEVRFEEHLLGCAECLGHLEEAEDFQSSLRVAVAEQAARTAVGLGVLGWLRRRGPGRLALALAAALPVAYLLWQTERLAGDLDRLRTAGEGPAPWAGTVAELESQLERSEAERARQVRDLEDRLGRQRQAVDDVTARLQALLAPQVHTAVFTLAAARGEAGAGDAPVTRIPRAEAPGWRVLAVELALVEHESYRVDLEDAGGRRLWRHDGLRPDALDTLTVSFHSSFLVPGDYALVVAGLAPGGAARPVGRYPFRVH